MVPARRKLSQRGGTLGVGTPDIIPRGASMGFNQSPVVAQPNQSANPTYPGGPYPPGSVVLPQTIPGFQPITGGNPAKSLPYKPIIKVLAINLANAVNNEVINMPGSILWCVDSTNSTDRVFIQLDTTGTNDFIPVGPGFAFEGTSFAGFILNLNTVSQGVPNPAPLVPGAIMYIAVINDPNQSLELLDIRA